LDKEPVSQANMAADASGGDEPPLLRGYTCLACGHRSATWAAFRAHRRECPKRLRPDGRSREGGASKGPERGPARDPEPPKD
jgi:hypothetical protein